MVDRWTMVHLDAATLPYPYPDFSFPHEVSRYETTAPEEVAGRIAGAEIVFTNKVWLTARHIAAAPNLKIIAVPAVGLDHLDREACDARGIQIFNAAGYADEGVAEHALTLMLMLRRRMLQANTAVRDGRWSTSPVFFYADAPFENLAGQTLGIMGVGGIGSALARKAEALGMTVLKAEREGASSPRPGYTPFEEVVRTSDILSLHIPATPTNQGMVDAAFLKKMKSSALLVNTGRGVLVNEADLLTALENGEIAGAALDVLGKEPPAADHPLLGYQGQNLVITPHCAWLGRSSLAKLVGILHDKIERAIADF